MPLIFRREKTPTIPEAIPARTVSVPALDVPIFSRVSNTFLQCRIRIVPSSLQRARLLESKDTSYDELLDAMRIVSTHGGTLSHADTNSFLASFGSNAQQLPAQVAALLATHAGIALREHFEYVNLRRANHNLPEVHVGIGIASGMTIQAINHEQEPDQSTEFADTVKVAEKLQEYTFVLPKGGILIHDSTYKNLESVLGQFCFGRSGPAQFPWSASESTIYEITGRHGSITPQQSEG
jgi:class 3 adenylate cyclase